MMWIVMNLGNLSSRSLYLELSVSKNEVNKLNSLALYILLAHVWSCHSIFSYLCLIYQVSLCMHSWELPASSTLATLQSHWILASN